MPKAPGVVPVSDPAAPDAFGPFCDPGGVTPPIEQVMVPRVEAKQSTRSELVRSWLTVSLADVAPAAL